LTARRRASITQPVRAIINGEPQDLPGGLTVAGLLRHLGVRQSRVAVERNGAVVKRAQHETEPVQDGDVIEVVSFVGGG
jgi:sulfur carrier protein